MRRAVASTRNGRIGVIGTLGTIRSRAYEDAFAAARDVRLTAKPSDDSLGCGFVTAQLGMPVAAQRR